MHVVMGCHARNARHGAHRQSLNARQNVEYGYALYRQRLL
jgi:hypothetical protein